MAFIKENPRSDYSYYNVVETVYKDGDPRHNELRYIGRPDKLSPKERGGVGWWVVPVCAPVPGFLDVAVATSPVLTPAELAVLSRNLVTLVDDPP